MKLPRLKLPEYWFDTLMEHLGTILLALIEGLWWIMFPVRIVFRVARNLTLLLLGMAIGLWPVIVVVVVTVLVLRHLNVIPAPPPATAPAPTAWETPRPDPALDPNIPDYAR